jgi:predicted nucleotidyltransferase
MTMRLAEALRLLAEHRDQIDQFGIKSLAIFGSVARDEARPDSDVDILVEFDRPVGYFTFFDVQAQLEAILGQTVDLFTSDSLRKEIREGVMKDLVRAA